MQEEEIKKEKIKVLFFISGLKLGGAEQSLFKILKYLDRDSFECVVFSFVDGPVRKKIEDLGTKVFFVNFFNCWLKLRNFIKLWKPHIVHTFMFHPNIIMRFIPKKAIHISSIRIKENKRWFHVFVDNFTEPLCKYYMVNSNILKDFVIGYGVPEDKVFVVENMVDFEELEKPPSFECDVLTIANLRKDKDYGTLLRAWKELDNNYKLTCIGGGDEEKVIKSLVARLGLKNVEFLGFRNDALSFLKGCKVFVLSTHQEGMSNSLLEAMSLGKPIVCTNILENSELIEDGVSGLLSEPNNPNDLAKCIKRLLEDRVFAEKLGFEARKKALNYDVRVKVKLLEKKYFEILGLKGV